MKTERARRAVLATAIVVAAAVSLAGAGVAGAAAMTKLSNVTIPASDGVNLVEAAHPCAAQGGGRARPTDRLAVGAR